MEKGSGSIPEKFTEAVERYPDRIALQIKRGEGYEEYPYQRVARMVRAIASSLIREGIEKGDRIAILSENRPEWGIAYLGILSAGATAVPLDFQLTEGEVLNLLHDSESGAVFASKPFLLMLQKLRAGLPFLKTIISLDDEATGGLFSFKEISQPREAFPLIEGPRLHSGDIASILYTSGTTGRPKGVMLSHGNFLANAHSISSLNLISHEDNILSLLPLHHSYPFTVTFLVPFLSGARVTYIQSLKPTEFIQAMQETGVTVLVGVPQLLYMLHKGIFDRVKAQPKPVQGLFKALLETSGLARRHLGSNIGKALFRKVHQGFGPSFRFLVSGGARLEPAVAEDFFKLGFTILEGYGLTETSPVISFNPIEKPKLGSVGLPIPGVEVKILDPDGQGIGEIAVRGPNVMRGYYRNPEASSQAFKEGWLLTGDLGYLDRDGYLFITGRQKEVIVLSTGKNIYPEELETHYLKSPYIKEICVLDVPDPKSERASSLQAIVVPDFDYLKAKGIANSQEALRWEIRKLSHELPAYKRIKGYRIGKGPLPRTRLGKLQRHLISEAYFPREGLEEVPSRPARGPEERERETLEMGIPRKIISYLRGASRKTKTVELDDNLELDLGIDSFGRVELLVALEEITGQKLPDSITAEALTVREVIQKVLETLPGEIRREEGIPSRPAEARPSWQEFLLTEPPGDVKAMIELEPGRFSMTITSILLMTLRLMARGLFRLKVFGPENLPVKGPYILTPNHASYIDGFVLAAALPKEVASQLFFLGYQKYFEKPPFSYIVKTLRVIPIDPDLHLYKAIQASSYVLQKGKVLCIFPEGGRTFDGEVQEFKKGVALLAKELDVPVVPVLIKGSFDVLSRHARWPSLRPLEVRFGRPLSVKKEEPEKGEGIEDYNAIAEMLRVAVLNLKE